MKLRTLVYAVLMTCLGLLLGRRSQAQGQMDFRTPGSDSVKVVLILNTDNFRSQTVDSVTTMTFLVGHVRLKEGKTLIDCDSMVRNSRDSVLQCYGNVHINDNDTTNIYSDYMKYQVNARKVYFNKNVRLTDGKGVLTTEELQYDLNTKVGVYVHGGKIVTKESVLTSEEATYYEDTKDVHFKKSVVLRDPQYDLSADSLLYNTESQVSTFITETFIQFKDSTKRTVRTRNGYYDLKHRKASFGQGPRITDGSQQLTGDLVQMDDSTGTSLAKGNAVYRDTAQGIVLTGGYMINNKKNNTFFATEKPMLRVKQDQDSIYMVADTLASGRLIDQLAESRQMEISDSLHKLYVDSLYRRSADSLHRHALADTLNQQDTLESVMPDSTHRMIIKDLSDSLGGKFANGKPPVPADSLDITDSLGRKTGRADSLGRKAADSAGRKPGTGLDSLGRKATDSLGKQLSDSTRKKRSPKELAREQKRKQRDAEQEQRDKVAAQKAAQKATADSISHVNRLRTDSIAKKNRAFSDSVSKRARFIKDSIYQASQPRTPKQLKADSLYRVRQANKQRRIDSLRMDSVKIAVADSLKRRAIDSLQQHIDDSVQKRAADSIRAIKVEEATITDTSLRYIKGYHHVRIFSDSLQAVGDSLYYSGKDSIFRLFYNPIAWGSNGLQITGDTMYIFTKNKKPSRLYVFENALAINKIGKNFYNQLKGTTINVFFQKGEVDFIRAKGNAESIYYVRDDNQAYTGVNKAHGDIIDMVFAPKEDGKGRELNRVVFRSEVEGSMIPFKKVVFDDMRLRGFKWYEDKRPKSKEELQKEKTVETDDMK